jgi:DNA polymerase III subunit epsilon
MTNSPALSWTQAPLVAVDLEGSGAQDRDDEAILEIALVPIAAGRPSLPDAYTTLINPGRPIPRRPWISPGLTDTALATAPPLSDIEPRLSRQLTGKILVGHNVSVDWRLLSRRCPGIQAVGLIDTLRLARHIHPDLRHKNLAALLDRYQLTDQVTELAPDSRPHRALWDTIGAALLLTALINSLPGSGALGLADLQRLAGLELREPRQRPGRAQQLPLL